MLPVALLSFGWCLNSIGLPAYHAGMGTGELRPNVYSHVSMASLNLLLGLVLGRYFNGVGVICGWGIALAAGGLCTTWLYLPREDRTLANMIPVKGLSLVIGVFGAVLLSIVIFEKMWPAVATTGSTHTWSTANASFVAGSVATLMYLLIVVLATTGHPVRKQLLSAVRSLSSKRLAGH